jgi:hypothetical protein
VSGPRVGTALGGSSPLVSGAGRCAGLGTDRRMMLGSITTSFRPPTSTRCSVSSRRTRTIFRFPSTWTDSITPTRRDALRPRSQLNMCFFRYLMPVSDFIYCRAFPMIPQRPTTCNVSPQDTLRLLGIPLSQAAPCALGSWVLSSGCSLPSL